MSTERQRTFCWFGVLLTQSHFGALMSKFQFAISSGPESVRQAGVVESDSFDDAVMLLGQKFPVHDGDSLEIGVAGFPPARYHCVGAVRNGGPVWVPAGRMAA
jgi:hypothetical protein